MKRKQHFLRLLQVAAVTAALASCQPEPNNPNIPEETEGWVPVYSTEKAAHAVTSEAPRAIENAGKIYVFGNYLFQVETGKGIHVLDVSHHNNPIKLHFISVMGAQEIAIKEKYLYTNNLNDLVVVDISNIAEVKLVNRIPSTFHVVNQTVPPENGYFECVDASKGVVTGWEKKTIKRPECSRN